MMNKTERTVESDEDPQEHGKNPTFEPFNVTDGSKEKFNKKLSSKSEHSNRAHFYKAMICLGICMFLAFFVVFLVVGGHVELFNEANKVLHRENFDQYMVHFNKNYTSDEEKQKRLEIYSENLQLLQQENLKKLAVVLNNSGSAVENTRQQAENQLQNMARDPNYLLLLLELVQSQIIQNNMENLDQVLLSKQPS